MAWSILDRDFELGPSVGSGGPSVGSCSFQMVVGFRLVLVDVGWIVLGRASDMEAARLARLAKGLGKFLCPVRFVQEWTDKWYGWLTVPLVPVWHCIGANDTGALFAMLWYFNFPDQGAGGTCNKDFWVKWTPNRLRHCLFVASLWACVWLLGTWPLGRPLSEGWRFFIPVTVACRTGFTIAWTFFTNFNQPFALVERIPGLEPQSQLPSPLQGHGMLAGWPP